MGSWSRLSSPPAIGLPKCAARGTLFFFSSRRRHTRLQGDWSSDVCSSDLVEFDGAVVAKTPELVVQGGDFDEAGDIASGHHRDPQKGNLLAHDLDGVGRGEIGRASCRERV